MLNLVNYGRPAEIDPRLALYAFALEAAELSASRSNLLLLSFWDESLSSILGYGVEPVGFVVGGDGLPYSDAVASRLDDWLSSGRLLRSADSTPDSSEALHPSIDVVETAVALASSDWGRLVCDFVESLRVDAARPRISLADDSADLRRLMRFDLDFVHGAWIAAGSPALTGDDMGAIHPDLAGRKGNEAAKATTYWDEVGHGKDGNAGMSTSEKAAMYGLFLLARTAKHDAEFGDGAYLRIVSATLAREKREEGFQTPDVVEVSFLAEGTPAATVSYHPVPPGGEAAPGGFGTVLAVAVEPGCEGRGYDVLALRHAIARGCQFAADQVADERLLASHGQKLPQGGWRLIPAHWRTCRVDNSQETESTSTKGSTVSPRTY